MVCHCYLWNRSRGILSKTTQKRSIAQSRKSVFQIWAHSVYNDSEPDWFTCNPAFVWDWEGEGKDKFLFKRLSEQRSNNALPMCAVFKHQAWQTSEGKELICRSTAHLSRYFQVALSCFASIKMIRLAWIPDTGVICNNWISFDVSASLSLSVSILPLCSSLIGYWAHQHCHPPDKIDGPAIAGKVWNHYAATT